ncbi:DUF4873 domain-containing protein [Nocardia sp. NPDC049149]|uniref:DUF4873 domain-containing protein n=1 Tax=Nocardia sp. NPDC049149 TaxID=3364315 RepID=UPI003718201C
MSRRNERTTIAVGPPEIVIVGADFAGLELAVELRAAGIHDFVVVEKADAADDPRRTIDKHRLREHLRLRAEVVTLDFDDADDRWNVGLADGKRWRPRVVMLATNSLTLQHEWRKDTAGFLGVATHGFPNMFSMLGPDSGGEHHSIAFLVKAQARYIRQCVELLRRTSSTRIEVRAAVQHEFHRRLRLPGARISYRRAMRKPDPGHYDLTVAADREPAHEYSGPAMLDAPGSLLPVTVTLSGHADPIDGRYHWYGRISTDDGAALPDPGRAEVLLTLPGHHPTAGRLQERDPWGNVRIVGIGAPPFPLESVPAH